MVPDQSIRSGWIVDPFAITRYDRSDADLQALLVFCCCVANKTAAVMAPKVNSFLSGRGDLSPFQWIALLIETGRLHPAMEEAKLGNYALREKGFRYLLSDAGPCLRTASAEDLERVPGIGPKTARFFIVHSREGARHAVIDTHMLKFLRDAGHDAIPDGSSPPNKDYARMEQLVLDHVEQSGLSTADFDLRVWTWYAGGNRGAPPSQLLARSSGVSI